MKILVNSTQDFLKYFIALIFLTAIACCFYACKSDSPITSGIRPDAYFNYSSMNIPYNQLSYLTLTSDNTIFLGTRNEASKISGGVITPLLYNDSSFYKESFSAYSNDYYIFTGWKNSDPRQSVLKICDNGVYSDYYLPYPLYTSGIRIPQYLARNKFLILPYSENRYFLFDNGTITEYPLNNFEPSIIGKSNNNYYLFGESKISFDFQIYRIDSDGPHFLRSEGPEAGSNAVYNLNNDIIRVKRNSSYSNTLSNFTEQGWTDIYTFVDSSQHESISSIIGNSKDDFTVFVLNSQTQVYSAYNWNGYGFQKQNNFPAEIIGNAQSSYLAASDYKNNSFCLYLSNMGSNKLFIGRKTEY